MSHTEKVVNGVYYLPIQVESSNKTKLRAVFDATARNLVMRTT